MGLSGLDQQWVGQYDLLVAVVDYLVFAGLNVVADFDFVADVGFDYFLVGLCYQDDFSDPSTGWYTGDDGSISYSYTDGEYLIGVSKNNWISWATIGEDLQDSITTVNVRPKKSTGDGGFGLICRYVNDHNYYGLEVSEDGYHSIWRYDNGEYVFLSYWAFSELIPQSQEMQITASCVGDRLSLAVNDTLLAEVTDSTFRSGDMGLFSETYDIGGLVAAFDNFVLRVP